MEHLKPLPLDTAKFRLFVRSFVRFYCALLVRWCMLTNKLRKGLFIYLIIAYWQVNTLIHFLCFFADPQNGGCPKLTPTTPYFISCVRCLSLIGEVFNMSKSEWAKESDNTTKIKHYLLMLSIKRHRFYLSFAMQRYNKFLIYQTKI